MSKKRTIYVAEENYRKATDLLSKAEIRFWNESGAFMYLIFITAIITAVVVGLAAWGISAIN